MGGFGSGTYHRPGGRRRTVEESLVLSVATLQLRKYRDAVGTLRWGSNRGDRWEVGYLLAWGDDDPIAMLSYRWGGVEDVHLRVKLEATPAHFGNRRWWFSCPLGAAGAGCNRRVGKLYLPPGGKLFGCRRCHRLTYRSAQEAHQDERLFARLGLAPEYARAFRERLAGRGGR
jgi:hypothetical protein